MRFIALLLAMSAMAAATSAAVASRISTGSRIVRIGGIPFTSNRAQPLGRRRATIVASSTPLLTETFAGTATQPDFWNWSGDTCLTAGSAATPGSSIGACAPGDPTDASGSGAVQLTTAAQNQQGFLLYRVPLTTSHGVQVVFTDYAYDGSSPGADGLSMLFADASKQVPGVSSTLLGSLGYAVRSAWAGIGFDEYGNFSSYGNGGSGDGFPGHIPETVAVRGAASSNFQYLGGVADAQGQPASLPFALDAPSSKTRPTNAPTFRVTLLPTSEIIVEIDHHDGNGFLVYYDRTVAGVNEQPALPQRVFLGFAASCGSLDNLHQIGGLTVSYLQPATPSFTPASIGSLSAWYDASDNATIAQTSNAVSAWSDRSGNGNTLTQTATASMPSDQGMIDGLPALSFGGAAYLTSVNAAFSTFLFNESTVFAVTSGTGSTQNSSVLAAGSSAVSSPRWDLRLFDGSGTHFDFNNTGAGRISSTIAAGGAAVWTASGSAISGLQYLRKDGTTLSSSTGPGASVSGTFPLLVGANAGAGASPSEFFTGSVGEVLVYDRALTVPETQSIEGYLACKWGLQNRLPASHPYRQTCPGSQYAAPAPTPAPTGAALVDPPQLVSRNGSLSLTLQAEADSNGNPHLYYNGSTTAPTLRLVPGDTLSVTLVNALPTPAPSAGYANDTNLHFHGLHVSPNAPSDDSIDLLALPGQTLQYRVAIPLNQPPGLYWYHSHAHGEAERQNLSGMSGALIVDGIENAVPAVAQLPERILIARDAPPSGTALPAANRKQLSAMTWAMLHANSPQARRARRLPGISLGFNPHMMSMGDSVGVRGRSTAFTNNPFVTIDPAYRHLARGAADTSDGHCTGTETPQKALTLNGATEPAIGIKPGEKQFWRFVNAGSDTYLDIAVDNAPLTIVAIDGVPIRDGVDTPSSLTVPDYVVPPASRVEFVVTGPPAGSTAYLRTKCFDAGSAGPAMPAAVLASIDPTTSPSDNARHRSARRAVRQTAIYRFPPISRTLLKNLRKRTITYSDQNTIDGVAYDPSAPPRYYAQLGTLEEWTVVNNSSQVHTFHIHQIHFVVEAVNGIAQRAQYVMDNVNVPAATASGPGTVKLLLDFTDPLLIGTFLFHCHILSHEDAGMMAKIRVGTAAPLAVNPASLSFASVSAAAQSATLGGGSAPYSVTGCSGVVDASISGSKVTVSPVASGSCLLTIADATGLTASLAVIVSAPPSPLSISPESVSFSAPNAAAQSATISGGMPPYTLSGCNGVASGAVSGSTLTVTPVAAGACSLGVANGAGASATLAVAVNGATSGSPGDNVTFHHDAGRTGWDPYETALTTTNVAGPSFGLIGTLAAPSGMPAFGKVYAQPLYVTNEKTSDGNIHNLVLIATMTDQVYAVDDRSGAVVWEHNFTNPASGITQQSWTDTGCADMNPDVGIMATPVADRAKNLLYVVVPTKENGVFHLRLHALSLESGADALSPVEATATVSLASGGTATVDPLNNLSRSALLEADGNIYVALGSHCDQQSTTLHGWLLSFNATTLAFTGDAIDTTDAATSSDFFLGSIWMSGFGPAADSEGNIYAVTGNGPYDGKHDLAMSALKLPGDLDITKAGSFTPYGELADSNSDLDLGSGGVLVAPDMPGTNGHLMLLGGKCGAGTSAGGTDGCQKYLLNRDDPGGIQPGDAGALWHASIAGAMFGGPAFFSDAAGNAYFVYGGGNPLSTYKLALSPPSLTVESSATVGCLECRDAGSQPVVSSNGTVAGTAVVWALKTPGNSGGSISLYAFDALTMSHTLYEGTAGPWTMTTGASHIGGALVSPLVANGRVYVPTDGSVAVFGLKQ